MPRAKGVREADLFAHHRLRLRHALRIAEQFGDLRGGAGSGGATVVANAAPFELGAKLVVQFVQVVDGVGAGVRGPLAGIQRPPGEHRVRIVDELAHDRRHRR